MTQLSNQRSAPAVYDEKIKYENFMKYFMHIKTCFLLGHFTHYLDTLETRHIDKIFEIGIKFSHKLPTNGKEIKEES